ncbi:hypothetical protein SODALDRAFT_1198 [Sodiomyces alkalinus F11]|uniref:Uncharacterized protein n=1 Tax=Sodiomyces alkalinus (strain CBS 110278 / VKM F-3762 / F11) TaxID=1314773 RepID=A0A3N2Q4Y2_SODAK|nr:hypothetical protein SODALDRAFT_1198 [Sodiomyces alkalinus F11]ROT41834.1 hypothetical protein SODALDRAFT_1198 [Sodiomyces alkalinus F11]
MALRYSPELLLHLRQSPLCIKPSNLPPVEEWMGPPPEPVRTPNKATSDRRHNDSLSGDQSNRRPGLDRFMSRNGANPDDIILGPPRTAFASTGAGGRNKSFDYDKESKDFDSRDRFNFRSRNGDAEGSDRTRDPRNHNFRRRGDADQDGEGWSTVKPRKSFGTEGAERFQGRMGAVNDRFNNDRKLRDKVDHDATSARPRRAVDNYGKDGDDGETRPRNGLNRGRSEPWFKSEGDKPDKLDKPERPAMTNRERIDRAKSWRDRDKDADTFEDRDRDRDRDRVDRDQNRHMGRNYERRWDRDHRNERDPEWFDEPAGEKAGGHTEEDFRKFMESMKGGKTKPPAAAEGKPAASEAVTPPKPEQLAPASAPAVESGPDKFFMAFASNSVLDAATPAAETPKDATPKPARSGAGKSSRFTSFFSAPQEDPSRRAQPEPAHNPAPASAATTASPPIAKAPDAEKEAFQVLLQKLQLSHPQARSSPPAVQAFQEPQSLPRIPPGQEATPASAVRSPGAFPQFPPPPEQHPDDLRSRQPQTQPGQDIVAPRPMMPSEPPSSRQDQLLQDLVNQRQHSSSQGSSRTEMKPNRNLSNAEFLMNLMRAQPEPMRTEQMLLRMHQQQQQQQQQPQRAGSMSQIPDREPDFPSNGRISQPRQMRGQPPPPGFMDEPFHHLPEHEPRPQPTQILQRPPPPPGLDPMNPNWMQPGGGGPLPPPQQRSMGPPPGLAGGPGGPGGPGGLGVPSRNHPIPGMFPPGPNFPPAGFPPPDTMGVPPPPRGMQPPPGFFGGLPPPGFMGPPGIGGGPAFGGPIPEAHGFPFDGRGMPPPGAAQAFRRQ